MRPVARAGSTLLELILALGLVAAALLAVGPVVGRTARVMTRGWALLEGTALASRARESLHFLPSGACGGGMLGQDSGRFVRVDWTASPNPAGLAFEAVIRDHGHRFPAETLGTVHRCAP